MDDTTAAVIAQLTHSPAFRALKDELEAAEQRYWDRFNKRVRGGEPIDQTEVDFMRAKFSAAKSIIEQPDKAAKHLERAKAEAERLADIEEKPYA